MDYDHLQRLGVRRIQLTIVSLLMFMLNKNMIHEDLLIHGDSVYDIIDKADHGTVQTELLRNSPGSGGNASSLPGEESRLFLCRMNVSRNARRQMRFGDQKVVLLQGRYLSYLPLCSRNEPVFIGSCTPVAMPETRESVVQGATNVFTTIHAMDMKYMNCDKNGEHYLGYSRQELGGVSWYHLVHWNYMREAQGKHRLISQSDQEKSCILLLRMETRGGEWLWVHCVLQVKDGTDSNSSSQPHPTQSVIVATNQVLSEREAGVMRANSWLYHYYTVQTKLQYGLAYPDAATAAAAAAGATASQLQQLQPSAAARLAAAAAYFPTTYDPTHYHHHQMVQQGLASPHLHHGHPHPNGNGYPYGAHPIPHYAPPHPHHHQYEQGVKDKESPLDFSLSSSAFDPYTSAASAYWSHHHSQGQSQQYHHHHHNHSSSTHAAQYYSNTIKTESVLSPSSVTSPSQNHHQQQQQQAPQQSWSLSISSSKSQVHISTTNISPVSNSSSSTSLPGRKRFKKGGSMVSSSGSESSTSASPPPSVAQRGTFSDSHHGHSSSSASVATASISSGHTARTRNIYKGLDGENSSTMVGMTTCPLTPSPVWEGQTQRVPDLATITHHSHNGHSGHGHPQGERDLTCYNNINSSELIHCVPTYLPYSSGVTPSSIPSTPNFPAVAAYHHPYSYGFPLPPYHHLPQGDGNSGGSPNKENRLPPTPESDTNGEILNQ
ncbi:Neuronal PAS domain-containing protein 4 [Folsomia candida]|uniref:Neuronal PAS domain-containing protein 4 n=1 Tax=Folsomia candida TaxID=158441 RepID=A0A226EVC9_FOLCA|nr:Neuronal PAS domain-containing protein 4 [Folsomia candida]